MRVSVVVDGGTPRVVLGDLDVVTAAGGPGLLTETLFPPLALPPLAADASVRVLLEGLQDRPFLTSLRLETAVAASDGGPPWSTGINCGAGVVAASDSADGRRYEADAGYTTPSNSWGRSGSLPPEFHQLRYARGSLSYAVPVPRPGRYRVHATFVELYHRAPGRRRMDVYVGGDGDAADTGGMVRAAASFDAYAAADNAGDTPVTLALPSAAGAVAADAVVRLTLVSVTGDPMVSTVWVEAMDE